MTPNKTDQILADLERSPGNTLIIPNDSPVWPQLARLAHYGVIQVVRTHNGVAVVHRLLSDPAEIGTRRNSGEEIALDDLMNAGAAGVIGIRYPHKQALKRLERAGIVRRTLATDGGQAQVAAVGLAYFPEPTHSPVLRPNTKILRS